MEGGSIDMTILLDETVSHLKNHGYSPDDVEWVGCENYHFTWEEFKTLSDITYDSGYGCAEIRGDLIIVGNNWWIARNEYDGSEWWEFHTKPERPEKHAIPKSLIGWNQDD